MRCFIRLAVLAAGLSLAHAQSQDVTTDQGSYTLDGAKTKNVNENTGANGAASTNVNSTTSGGSGVEIGGEGNVVSGGQTNAQGSYNGYGNLNHDINSSYNGNTVINNNYGTAPKVTCIGDWCTEDPPCAAGDATCKHQRVVYQDGIYQTEDATDDSWDRLVQCEGSRCHYNRCYDEECSQKVVCANGQCTQQACDEDECLRKLVCTDGQCSHEPCDGNECGNRYVFSDGEYQIAPTCKGAKCPRPQMPGSGFLTRVQEIQLGSGHRGQTTLTITLTL